MFYGRGRGYLWEQNKVRVNIVHRQTSCNCYLSPELCHGISKPASDWRTRKNQLPVAHNKDDILHTNLVLRLKDRENKAGAGAEEEDDGSSSSVAARRCSLQRSCPSVRPSRDRGILLPTWDWEAASPGRGGWSGKESTARGRGKPAHRDREDGRRPRGRRQSRTEQSRAGWTLEEKEERKPSERKEGNVPCRLDRRRT